MYRNPNLLELAKDSPCLLNFSPKCLRDDGSTTVAAHSNQMIHGKGRAIKASDAMTVWACYLCHTELDQGNLTKQKKAKVFDEAWYRQVGAWHEIADNPTIKPWRREAAKEALKHLGVRDGK